jgi:hypothetical protein
VCRRAISAAVWAKNAHAAAEKRGPAAGRVRWCPVQCGVRVPEPTARVLLDDAEGTATAAGGGLTKELNFEDVIVALGPTGAATSTCSATAATLTTSTTTIDLTR